MEEEKAAAYYDELTRKGEGAARFKQGLGFSSTSNAAVPSRGSALPSSSSSFLANFVRASSPSKDSELQKEAQLLTIQNKLKKKPNPSQNQNQNQNQNQSSSRGSKDHRSRDSDRHSTIHTRPRSRSRSRSRDDHRSRRRRSSSRERNRNRDRDRDRDVERERERDRERDRDRRKRRSRSRSVSDEDRVRRRGRGRSRSVSPRDRRSEKMRGDVGKVGKDRKGGIDYGKLIEGYDKMSPADRVKAKMKLQLSETAKKDAINGMGSGWERFDFDKDAPLDDEEIEVAEDDAELVKHIGQSFRFSAVEARREDAIKAAHDEAMFGASSVPPSVDTDSEVEGDNYKKQITETAPATNLISDQVLAMQRGSWRDRVRKVNKSTS